MGRLISEKYAAWQAECEERFQQLKKNEEELNRIFIDIYGLQDELTPDVADKDVTVHLVAITPYSNCVELQTSKMHYKIFVPNGNVTQAVLQLVR